MFWNHFPVAGARSEWCRDERTIFPLDTVVTTSTWWYTSLDTPLVSGTSRADQTEIATLSSTGRMSSRVRLNRTKEHKRNIDGILIVRQTYSRFAQTYKHMLRWWNVFWVYTLTTKKAVLTETLTQNNRIEKKTKKQNINLKHLRDYYI